MLRIPPFLKLTNKLFLIFVKRCTFAQFCSHLFPPIFDGFEVHTLSWPEHSMYSIFIQIVLQNFLGGGAIIFFLQDEAPKTVEN